VHIKRNKLIEKTAKTHLQEGFHASFYQFQIFYERAKKLLSHVKIFFSLDNL
jgi:hypothetical protein